MLADGSTDANWMAYTTASPAPPTTGGVETSPKTQASFPTGATWQPAYVRNLAPGAWAATPYSNAQWISYENNAQSRDGDWYYQYQFNLDPSVDPSSFSLLMNFMADNDLAAVWVNGTQQSVTGVPQDSNPSDDPYQFLGFHTANTAQTTLSSNWQTGTNTIVVQVKSGQPFEGFLAQIRPSALCPVNLSVTDQVSPRPYIAGGSITYTAVVSNAGPGFPTEATVQVTVPGALTGVTWTCAASSGSFCTASGTGAVSDTVDLAVNGTLTYTITGNIPIGTSSTLTSTATAAPPAGATDANCSPNCSATANDTSTPTPTTVTVNAVPTTSVFGQQVTLSATVNTTYGGTPTGTVTFTDQTTSTQIGSPVTYSGTQVSINTSSLTVASHTIQASYTSNNGYAASNNTTGETVGKDTTTTALGTSGSPSAAGTSVTFTAHVAASSPGAGSPTGSVTFYDDTGVSVGTGPVIGTGTVNAGTGNATTSTSSLAVGAHSIDAIYGGDGNDNASTSSTLVQTVNLNAPNLVVTSSSAPTNTSTYGTDVTFTATLTGNGGTPTGTVTFSIDGVQGNPIALSGGVASFDTSSLSGGSHTIQAVYSGDAKYQGTNGQVSQTVNPASTTTGLLAAPNPSVYGQAIQLTATVNGVVGGATPTGNVSFYVTPNGGSQTLLGTVSLNGSAQATFSTSSLTPGSYSFLATYAGDGPVDYSGSSSSPVSQTVNESSTTTSVGTSSNPATVGASVKFTATVSASAPGSGTPTGTVTFLDGTTVLGTGSLSGGVATYSTTALATGTHPITASYASDGNFASSTSSPLSQVISQDSASVTVQTTGSPSAYGASVTFTATVASGSSGGTPTGTVSFTDGTTSLGNPVTLVNGVGTLTTSALTTTTHTITATYSGDVNHDGGETGSVTQVVNPATTATVVVPTPSTVVFGQPVTLVATLTPTTQGTAAPTGTITFYDGAASLGNVALSSGTATLVVSTLSVGDHTITGTYDGDTNYATSTSAGADVTVNQAATTTAISTSQTPAVLTTSVTFTAVVSPVSPGAGTPTGTVTFLDGATTLGTGTLSGGIATFSTSTLLAGSHTITAAYGGDLDFTASTSSALSQVIALSGATVSLSVTPSPGTYGGTETFTITVTGTDGTPTGSVKVTYQGTTLGTGTLAPGSSPKTATTSFQAAGLPVGTLTLDAIYSGDSTYVGTTSTAILVVNKAPTTTTLTSSLNPSALGQAVTFTATVSSAATGFTGSVTFMDGAKALGAAALSGSTATLTTSALTVGAHSITAIYSGDANFAVSTSTVLNQSVGQGGSVTTLTSSKNPSGVGQAVTFTATVSPAGGPGTPTGTVTFTDGSNSLGTGTLSGGVATLTTSTLAAGTHSITAAYGGDGNFSPSTSAPLSQQVVANVATIKVTVNPPSGTYGDTETLTVTVTGSGPAPTGTVTIGQGSTKVGGGPLVGGVLTITTSTLPAGSLVLTVTYGGDTNYPAGSVSASVGIAKAQTTTALDAPSTAAVGATVTLTATVSSAVAGFTGSVTFMDGTKTLGTVTLTGATAVLTTSSLGAGAHTLTAVYGGDTNFSGSTSSPVTVTLSGAAGGGGDAGAGGGTGAVDGGSDSAAPSADGGAGAGTSGSAGGPAADGGPSGTIAGGGCDMAAGHSGSGATTFILVGLAMLAGRRRRRVI